MPVDVIIDSGNRLVTVLVKGRPSPAELKEAMVNFYQSPEGREGFNTIWDLSRADASHLCFDDVSSLGSLAERNSEMRRGAKTVILAPRDIEYGLSRILAAMVVNRKTSIAIFREMDEALAWLAEDD